MTRIRIVGITLLLVSILILPVAAQATEDNDASTNSFAGFLDSTDQSIWNSMVDDYSASTGTTPKASDYGYGDPLPGESMSDYIRREDPELYGYMEGQYDAITGNDNASPDSSSESYSYGGPEPGESKTDYMQREDPEFYGYLEGRYDAYTGQ